MVLMRKDVLYECVKRYVKKRKEDPYAFFTPSLRTRKFNFSCCEADYFDNVMTKFIVYNRTDKLTSFVFSIRNCQIARSRSLPHHINYKFMSVRLLKIKISQ